MLFPVDVQSDALFARRFCSFRGRAGPNGILTTPWWVYAAYGRIGRKRLD